MTRVFAYFALAAVCLGMAGGAYYVFSSQSADRFANCRNSRVAAGSATIGGPFSLVNAQGERVTDADVVTKPTLVYFGYTFCPDFCPNDMSRNAIVQEDLAEAGIDIGVVFVSIDPERDDPDAVGEFASLISPNIIGLTGSKEDVDAAAKAYRVFYRKASDDEFYLVDHSTFTYLVDPKEGFLEFFGSDLSAADMQGRVGCFVEKL